MNTRLTKNEIMRQLKEEKPYLIQNFGVLDIGLFGSFAKGQAREDSDIDLIVELIEPRFDWLAGLQVYLEKKFNHKIEIVRKVTKKIVVLTKELKKK